jgi:hypothetical protein
MVADDDLPEVTGGLNVGVSISRSEDLARFGLTETHVRMALGEIARAVLVADGRLTYGGHLRADGYTLFLVQEIERLGRRNRPFTGYIPFSVHRAMSTDEINDRVEDVSVLGSYVFLDADGAETDPLEDRLPEAAPVDESTERRALSAARAVMSEVIDGRVALGGQRAGFRGRMPGVIEETLLAVRAGKPVFIAGGYGGASGDMAVALGNDPENWLGFGHHQQSAPRRTPRRRCRARLGGNLERADRGREPQACYHLSCQRGRVPDCPRPQSTARNE